MYCPTCMSEYQAGVNVCAECGVALVDALPAEIVAEPITWTTLATYRDLPAALVTQAMLQASGVPCFLANYHIVAINWQYALAVGWLQLCVPIDTATDAVRLLQSDDVAIEGDWRLPEATCPHCGSATLRGDETPRITAALALLLPAVVLFLPTAFYLPWVVSEFAFFFGAVIVVALRGHRWRCVHCSRTWRFDRSIPSVDGGEYRPIRVPTVTRYWLLFLVALALTYAMLRSYGQAP